MERKWTIAGMLLLITGIMLGAFGAHALKDIITDPEKLVSFETGVRYQLLHGVAFLTVPFLMNRFGLNTKWSFRLLLAGVILFSCSIYLLTMQEPWNLGGMKKVLGPITPLGGTLMIVGWCVLLAQMIKKK